MTSKFLRLTYAVLVLAAACASAAAQTRTDDAPVPISTPAAPAVVRSAKSAADEDFELNIAERRITEGVYEASLSVAVGEEGAGGLNLRVGVAVGASEIDVLLRNVRGRVRFRATLEQVLRRLNERRTGSPTISDAPPNASPSPLK